MAYPVQVPPGHMMQQVVDGMGTLRHVILSPEPRGIAAMPPYVSGGSAGGGGVRERA